MIEETCLFVFLLFLNENRVVSQKQMRSLKGMFGTISNSAADSMRKVSKSLALLGKWWAG